MSSLILVASYILQKFTHITTTICLYFFHLSCFPPQVASSLAGYDNGLQYALNPCAFLSRCQ